MSLSWLPLLLLGAAHGVNPGMGWLFAVGLGLQEKKRRAVWRALLPLALGHAIAIGSVVILAAMIGLVLPQEYLKWLVAAMLLGLGIYRLVRNRHPRYGGMRVNARELTIWSLLMASAHGAGLMVVPFVMGASGDAGAAQMHAQHVSTHGSQAASVLSMVPGPQAVALLATLVHSLGYLIVTALIAMIVYEKVGLRLLRTAWINLDLIWAGALILTAVCTPLI